MNKTYRAKSPADFRKKRHTAAPVHAATAAHKMIAAEETTRIARAAVIEILG